MFMYIYIHRAGKPNKIQLLQLSRKKSISKITSGSGQVEERSGSPSSQNHEEIPRPMFKVDAIYILMAKTIDEILDKSIENRRYHPTKSVKLCEEISKNVRDRVKELDHKKYRIVSLCSIIECCTQSVCYRTKFFIDNRTDNFVSYTFQNANIQLVALVILVLKK